MEDCPDNKEIKYKIVIARYHENLDWINEMDQTNIIIYNKSEVPLENAINRPNEGRDVETFLYHIIENYENLSDYVIFLQGNPFDHLNLKGEKINQHNLQNKINELIYSKEKINVKLLTPHVEYHWYNPGLHKEKYYSLFFNSPFPKELYFSAGCQYIVSKKNILCRPKKFYEKLRTMLLQSKVLSFNISHFDPTGDNSFDIHRINGWTVERMFSYIFNDEIELSDEIKEIIYADTDNTC